MAAKRKDEIFSKFTCEIENIEPNKLKLTLNLSPELFRAGLTHSYNVNKKHFNIPGFRKGKAPRRIIEQMYGKEIFYEDAIDYLLSDAYESALDKHDLEPVFKPDLEPGEISEKEGAVFYMTFYTRPEAEIDDYFGLTYPTGNAEPTEEEIQEALRAEQEKNSRQISVDRPAEMNDIVTINFTGYMDGEAFEGGAGEDHDLTLGAGRFIPGFEEQLVGHIPGDDVDVEVTFPADYQHETYAGKPATFKVEVLDVKTSVVPEIDDDFAQDVSEFDTLAEYREDIAKRIKEHKETNLENDKRRHLVRQLVEKATMDIPEAMYFGRLADMLDDYKYSIESRGMDFENYLRFAQLTEERLLEEWRGQAEEDVKSSLVLEAIGKKENITVDEESLRAKVSEVTERVDEELDEVINAMHKSRRRTLERSILCEKALNLVLEKATAVEGTPIEPVVLDEE